MIVQSGSRENTMLLRDLAYQKFKESLYLEKLKPGQFITQRQLSEILDVPLGPVREALQRISAAGFVNIIDKRGIQIVEATPKSLCDAYELRIVLVVAAIRKGISSEVINQLKRVDQSAGNMLKEMKNPLSKTVAFNYLETDWEFDVLIVDSMDNQQISDTFRLSLDKIKVARLREKSTLEQFEAAQHEHQAILKALSQGDNEQAAELMEEHSRKALKRGLGLVEE